MSKYIKQDNYIYNEDNKPQCILCDYHYKDTNGTHCCRYGKQCMHEKESEAREILQKEKAYMDSHAGRAQSEAFSMAINALEKQIPKKPIYDYAKCPICGHEFEYGINAWECEYCSECGQRLDWSDE